MVKNRCKNGNAYWVHAYDCRVTGQRWLRNLVGNWQGGVGF